MPRTVSSLEIIGRIERGYRLPAGYFRKFMGNAPRAASGHGLKDISASERRRLAWHLPEDFSRRSPDEQEEILHWVRIVIISGATEYRRYQAAAIRQRSGMRFSCAQSRRRRAGETSSCGEPAMVIDAPPLNREMAELLSFRASIFATFGMQRNGIWGEQTAQQKVEHFGLWFGALAAAPDSDVQGFGADPACLSFATMIFPQVWDWYLQWRERRRGFFIKWEVDLRVEASALCREETGWLCQTPGIAAHLCEIDGW